MSLIKRGSSAWKVVVGGSIAVFVIGLLCADLCRVKSTNASILGLPGPTAMVTDRAAGRPPLLKGLHLDPQNPLHIDFILDTGDERRIEREEASRLVSYFLAAVTTPQEDLWVNLSPYESDRVLAEGMETTELGRDLLAQDYLLKQLASSLTHPDTPTGEAYWRVENGKSTIENRLGKIWIVPDKAEVYESGTTAVITAASLRLECEDAAQQVLLPAITKDVNEGRNFARLRQIYHSILLGLWFKEKFKETFFAYYIDQARLNGVDTSDPALKEKIFGLYVESFKKGVYDTMRSDPGQMPAARRRFFSGGNDFSRYKISSAVRTVSHQRMAETLASSSGLFSGLAALLRVDLFRTPDERYAREVVKRLQREDLEPEELVGILNRVRGEGDKAEEARIAVAEELFRLSRLGKTVPWMPVIEESAQLVRDGYARQLYEELAVKALEDVAPDVQSSLRLLGRGRAASTDHRMNLVRRIVALLHESSDEDVVNVLDILTTDQGAAGERISAVDRMLLQEMIISDIIMPRLSNNPRLMNLISEAIMTRGNLFPTGSIDAVRRNLAEAAGEYSDGAAQHDPVGFFLLYDDLVDPEGLSEHSLSLLFTEYAPVDRQAVRLGRSYWRQLYGLVRELTWNTSKSDAARMRVDAGIRLEALGRVYEADLPRADRVAGDVMYLVYGVDWAVQDNLTLDLMASRIDAVRGDAYEFPDVVEGYDFIRYWENRVDQAVSSAVGNRIAWSELVWEERFNPIERILKLSPARHDSPKVLATLTQLFLKSFKDDFSHGGEFLKKCYWVLRKKGVFALRTALCEDKRFLASFKKIVPGSEFPSLSLYGRLFYHITGNARSARPYMECLYDKFEEHRDIAAQLVVNRADPQHHVRNDSTVNFYPKSYGYRGKNPVYRPRVWLGETNPAAEPADIGHAFERALQVLDTLGDPVVDSLVAAFRETGTVVLLDMPTDAFYASHRRREVQMLHCGRARHVMYFSRKYIRKIDSDDPEAVNELAAWMLFALRSFEIFGRQPVTVRREMTNLAETYFLDKENLRLFNPDVLRKKLAGYIREYIMYAFTDGLEKIDEYRRKAGQVFRIPYHKGPENRSGDPKAKELLACMHAAQGLLHLSNAFGMHSMAKTAYRLLKQSVCRAQSYDPAGLKPLRLQQELVKAALLYGFWDEFLRELEIFLSKGYRLNTQPEDVPGALSPCFRGENDFSRLVESKLQTHLRVAVSDSDMELKVRDTIRKVRVLFAEFKSRMDRPKQNGSVSNVAPAVVSSDVDATRMSIDVERELSRQVSVRELLDELKPYYEEMFPGVKIHVYIDDAVELRMLYVHGRKVLSEVIENALRGSGKDSEGGFNEITDPAAENITISFAVEGNGEKVLRIVDDGKGIPPEAVKKIESIDIRTAAEKGKGFVRDGFILDRRNNSELMTSSRDVFTNEDVPVGGMGTRLISYYVRKIGGRFTVRNKAAISGNPDDTGTVAEIRFPADPAASSGVNARVHNGGIDLKQSAVTVSGNGTSSAVPAAPDMDFDRFPGFSFSISRLQNNASRQELVALLD